MNQIKTYEVVVKKENAEAVDTVLRFYFKRDASASFRSRLEVDKGEER